MAKQPDKRSAAFHKEFSTGAAFLRTTYGCTAFGETYQREPCDECSPRKERSPRDLAWLTFMLRPPMVVSFRPFMAASAAAFFAIPTKAKPLGSPAALSVIRFKLDTSPKAEKSSAQVVFGGAVRQVTDVEIYYHSFLICALV